MEQKAAKSDQYWLTGRTPPKPVEFLPSPKRNWLACRVRLRDVYWQQALEVIAENFESGWKIIATAGEGAEEPLHMSLLYRTEPDLFDVIVQMAEAAQITEDDFGRTNFPYVFDSQYYNGPGVYIICQELTCPKATQFKRTVEKRFNWKDPTEVAEGREIPFHTTMYTVRGTPKPGAQVRCPPKPRTPEHSQPVKWQIAALLAVCFFLLGWSIYTCLFGGVFAELRVLFGEVLFELLWPQRKQSESYAYSLPCPLEGDS